MVAVQIAHREVENHQRLKRRAGERGQETPQVRQLDLLPGQSAADVKGMDRGVVIQRAPEQDGTIQAAADEDGCRVSGHRLYFRSGACRMSKSGSLLVPHAP